MKKIMLAALIFVSASYAQMDMWDQVPMGPRTYQTVLNGASYWGGTPQYIVKQTLISPILNGGGFDSLGTGGADVFKYWLENANGGRIADTIIAGNRCIVIQPNGAGDFVAFEQNTILSPGKLYRASYSILSNVSATVGIYIGVYGGAVNVQNIQAGAWARFTSIRNATDARLYFRCTTPNALIIFDNITLEEVEGSADLNGGEMLPNPFCEPNTTGYTGNGTTVIAYTTADKHAGAGCIQVTQTSPSLTNALYVVTGTQIDSGKNYTVEFWAKSVSGATTLNMRGSALSTQIGTGSFTVTTSWAKYVRNVTCLKSGSLTIGMYLSGDGVFLIDDVSLTQSSDAVIWSGGVNAPQSLFDASGPRLIHIGEVGASRIFVRGFPGAGHLQAYVDFDPTIYISAGGVNVNDGKQHTSALIIQRTGNLRLVVDGTSSSGASLSAVGKLNGITKYFIGSSGAGQYWSGRIGQTYLVKYTSGIPADIDSKIATANAIYKSGRIVPPWVWGPTATIVGNWDWSQGGRDRSGLGNDLVGSGNPTTAKTRR